MTEAVAVNAQVAVDFERGLLVELPSLQGETLGDWTNRIGAAAIEALSSGCPQAVVATWVVNRPGQPESPPELELSESAPAR